MTQTDLNKTATERPDWLSNEVWPFQIRTAQIEGTTVAYTDEGRGPTLLLVHDGMWSFIWGQLIELLRDRFRVVTLDFPGSGLSPASASPVTLEGDSRLLESFCDHLSLGELTLIAHDLGGGVGLGFAARRPELVSGMVMSNSFGWPPHVGALRVMLKTMGSRPLTGFDVATNLIPKMSSGGFGVGRHLDKAGRAAFLGPFRNRGPRRRFHDLMGSVMAEIDYLAGVEKALTTTLSGKPLLTIYGERNDPFGFQAKFREYFPDAEEMVIPKGNHFPMCDDPDGFARAVAEWHMRIVTSPRR